MMEIENTLQNFLACWAPDENVKRNSNFGKHTNETFRCEQTLSFQPRKRVDCVMFVLKFRVEEWHSIETAEHVLHQNSIRSENIYLNESHSLQESSWSIQRLTKIFLRLNFSLSLSLKIFCLNWKQKLLSLQVAIALKNRHEEKSSSWSASGSLGKS